MQVIIIQTGVTHAEAKQGKECQNIPMMGRFKDQMLCGCDEGYGGGYRFDALARKPRTS